MPHLVRLLHAVRPLATVRSLAAIGALTLLPGVAAAQHEKHDRHPTATAPAPAQARPTSPGQDAYGAIAEIVRLLEADPATDWSKVDLERLRQHLIDMNEVTLRSTVRQRAVPGGLAIEVTGSGRTEPAIRAMTAAHARQLGAHGLIAATAVIPGGARLTVTAADPSDGALVAKVRGLGFIGVMALGDHHGPHHLAMARGGAMQGHDH